MQTRTALAVVLLSGLAACTGEVTGDTSNATVAASPTAPTAQDASPAPASTAAPTQGDTSLSDADLRAAVEVNNPSRPHNFQDTLDPFWRSLNLEGEPPEVLPVRTVTVDEANEAYVECMAEQGFPSHVDQHGQEGIEFSMDQFEAMKLAQYVCYARYPLQDRYYEPYSVDQLRAIYDWNRTEVTQCLRDRGLEASTPPSFEAFAERYALTGREYWTATEGVDPTSLMSMGELCAETPPDDLLYGDGE